MPSVNKIFSGVLWMVVALMVAWGLPVTEPISVQRILAVCMFLNGISKLLND